jgi:hypothetical protein
MSEVFVPTAFNPMRMFRAPENWQRLRRPDIENGYFTTRRETVENVQSALAIYPQDFVYKPNPTLELEFKLWEDYISSDQRSVHTHMKLLGEGYNIALAKDFWVNPRVAMAWKSDGARLTFGGQKQPALVLMWCTGEEADATEQKRLRWSNDVQRYAEKTMEKLSENLGKAGIATVRPPSVTIGESEEPSARN